MTRTDIVPLACTLIDILRQRAAAQGDQIAYTFLSDAGDSEYATTYGELDQRARSIGAWLQSEGASGERVLLLLPPGLDYIRAFFGCLYAGAVAVPAYPPWRDDKFERLRILSANAKPVLGITSSSILGHLKSLEPQARILEIARWLAIDQMEQDWSARWRDLGLAGDTLAFLQYTSGSTGDPKGVMVRHGNLLANSAMVYRSFGHSNRSRGVIWLPPYHDMGLIGGIVQPLYGGFPVTLMSPATFLMRPVRWLQTISRTRATISGGPNFAYDICARRVTAEQRAELDLSSWEVAFTGSETIRPDTLERFSATFANCGFRREAFYPSYGLAEATLFVSGGAKKTFPVVYEIAGEALRQRRVIRGKLQKDAKRLVSCGMPASGLKVFIVDPESLDTCPADQVGEIWVSGASVGRGYWNRPEESQRTFNAYIRNTGEGPFLRTGDLGFFSGDDLVVVGRLKDVIIVAGRNHYPHDIEETVVQAHPSLRDGACAAFSLELGGSEKLVVMAEADSREDNGNPGATERKILEAVRHSVAKHHDLYVHEIILIKRGKIPKTTSGKIQRHVCRLRFLKSTMAKADEKDAKRNNHAQISWGRPKNIGATS